MFKLLNSHTVAFRLYQKKYCILHLAFISSVASPNKCSEFHFIFVFTFLPKYKALYEHKFLEQPFQITIQGFSVAVLLR